MYFVFPSIERQFKSWIPGRRKAHEELAKFFGMIHAMADERRQVILNSTNTVVADEQKKHAGEKDLLTLMIEAEHEGQGRLTDEEFEVISCFFVSQLFRSVNYCFLSFTTLCYFICRVIFQYFF